MTNHQRTDSVPPPSFAAFRYPGFRRFVIFSSLAMMADNVEHVISYWMMWEQFHLPALGGYAVVSHWLPFLLFSVYAGALGDRFDPRRLIQIGMSLFMFVSLAWGILFFTHTLQIWHAVVLLLLHGVAGVLWSPLSQLLIHDMIPAERLQSAVRLNATGRYLGMLVGPAVGSGLLLAFGPAMGLWVNAFIYLPLTLWLWKAPYGPKFRTHARAPTSPVRKLSDVYDAIQSIKHYPIIASMTLLSGGAAFFIGNSYQAQMPSFAHDLGRGDPGVAYSLLLAADAAGALSAGIGLEMIGALKPQPKTALLLAFLWCGSLAGFAITSWYPLALALLFCAGFLELSFNSMSQALVQLHAPLEQRGRIIGVFSMASSGMRTFSGVMVGLIGQYLGVHWSLSISAGLLAIMISFLISQRTRSVPSPLAGEG